MPAARPSWPGRLRSWRSGLARKRSRARSPAVDEPAMRPCRPPRRVRVTGRPFRLARPRDRGLAGREGRRPARDPARRGRHQEAARRLRHRLAPGGAARGRARAMAGPQALPPRWSMTIRRSTRWRDSSRASRSSAAGRRTGFGRTGSGREPIAIIGIGCRFPGASGPEEFWRAAPRRRRGGRPDPGLALGPRRPSSGSSIPRRGGFLRGSRPVRRRLLRHLAPRGGLVDPQQRLLLEVAWEALEDAGQAPERLAGDTRRGVRRDRHQRLRRSSRRSAAARATAIASRGPRPASRPTGSRYLFDFRGPSLAIDTACSSSLVAVHLACQSLLGRRIRAGAGGRGEPDPLARGVRELRQGAGSSPPTAAARRSTPRPTATSAARGRGWWCSSRSRGPRPTATRSTP